jgi:predicted nucleic acid-binding protein
MLRIVDASVLLAIARGERDVIFRLMMTRKREVAVPEPVIVHTAVEVRMFTQAEAVERWTRLVGEVPRLSWNEDVTEALLDLEPPAGLAVDLDTITAAHAVARKAAVFTREPERYSWVRRLRIEAI